MMLFQPEKNTSSNQEKQCIQVLVSNCSTPKLRKQSYSYCDEYSHECVWYIKSDFIVLCLTGLKETNLFQMKYKDVNMSNSFTDFSVHANKHGSDK